MLGRVGEGVAGVGWGEWGVAGMGGEGGSWGGVVEGDSWGCCGGVIDVSRDTCWQKPSFSKTGNQQACWAKVKVVADVIFYTLFLLLCRERDLPTAQ